MTSCFYIINLYMFFLKLFSYGFQNSFQCCKLDAFTIYVTWIISLPPSSNITVDRNVIKHCLSELFGDLAYIYASVVILS